MLLNSRPPVTSQHCLGNESCDQRQNPKGQASSCQAWPSLVVSSRPPMDVLGWQPIFGFAPYSRSAGVENIYLPLDLYASWPSHPSDVFSSSIPEIQGCVCIPTSFSDLCGPSVKLPDPHSHAPERPEHEGL